MNAVKDIPIFPKEKDICLRTLGRMIKTCNGDFSVSPLILG